MDLALYGRVLRRHKVVVVVGLALAVVLALLSYYRVGSDGMLPTLEPRKAEIWQSSANVFLTESGFPAGRLTIPLVTKKVGGETVTVPKYNEPGRFASLASLYARLATSDEVRERIVSKGPPFGEFSAFPSIESSAGPLPIVLVLGRATSPAAAKTIVTRGLDAFISYVTEQQAASGTPEDQRIQLRVLNAPASAVLLEPRKKTLPIVVFLAVVMASITLAFIFENASRGRSAVEVVADAEVVAKSEPQPVRESQRVPVKVVAEPDMVEPEPEVRTVRRWA